MRRRACPIFGASVALAIGLAACGGDPTAPPGDDVRISFTAGPEQLRQGDVAAYGARVTDESGAPVQAALQWSVEPGDAGLIRTDGRFVGYEPGTARIVARHEGARAERAVEIAPRDVTPATFTVIGRGRVDHRFTSDLWLHGTVAYTGTWGTRSAGGSLNQGDRLYVWDVSSPAAPLLVDSVAVDAGTVNDVKVREDGAIAVLTHEGSADGRNGITILDLADPLHPRPILRYTDELESGVHNVWVEGDHVYAVTDGSSPSRGLRVVDISDPASPAIAAAFYGGSGTSFGQFLHDVYVRDGLAFLAHWNAGLIVLDVGNGVRGGSPSDPVEVGRVRPQGDQTHNAWYWPERGYAFVGEEDFSTPGMMHVIDLADPAAPREVATFRVPGDTPHNFWLDEEAELLYLAWYSQGLWALDVSGELLGELGRQGRVIASTRYDGSGACPSGFGTCTWAPQLHDGLVWVSDMNSGLWALALDP